MSLADLGRELARRDRYPSSSMIDKVICLILSLPVGMFYSLKK